METNSPAESLDSIDYFDGDFLQDPYPTYARLRAEAPVFRDPKNDVVYVSTYDLVNEVCRQPEIFSSKFGHLFRGSGEETPDPEVVEILSKGVPPADALQTADPPYHALYRRIAQRAFGYKRILQMGDYVAEVANALIDNFIEEGRCEFKSQFGDEIPMTVIADALGVPRESMPTFRKWSHAHIDQLGGMADRDRRAEAARLIIEFQNYFVERIEERRKTPGEDVVSEVANAEIEIDGEKRLLNHSELMVFIGSFLVAGNETTAHSFTAGLYYLLTHPEQLQRLQNDPNPEDISNFVEETLRILTPTNNMWRIATQDTELGGVAIKKGDKVLVRFGSANRDSAYFENGEAFDPERSNAKEHIAFGSGIHVCLGAQLARKELNVAFPIILKRLKNIRFADGVNTFRYAPNFLLRGVEQLHLEFDRGPRVS